jgi:hypothetical protein
VPGSVAADDRFPNRLVLTPFLTKEPELNSGDRGERRAHSGDGLDLPSEAGNTERAPSSHD